MQFFGTYNHKVDTKGRVALPSKFRRAYVQAEATCDASDAGLVVTPSPLKFDNVHSECLYIFTVEDFNKWVMSFFEAVGGYNPRDKKHEMQMLALHANVEDIALDSAGRINLPQKFIEKAALKSDVSVIGNGDRIEIWDSNRVEEKVSQIDLEKLLYD